MALRASDGFSAIRTEFNLLRAEFDAISGGLSIPSEIVYVSSLANFPPPVGNVITLTAGTTYILAGDIDLLGDRLVGVAGSVIMGSGSTTASLTSTGLAAAPLITANNSFILRDFTIKNLGAGVPALDIDAVLNPGAYIELDGMIFNTVNTVGTVKNINVLVLQTCNFIATSGFTLDGTIAIVAISSCGFDTAAAGTFFIFPATAIISTRFRMLYCAFNVAATETGISVHASATVPAESFVLDNVSFVGAGTYLSGILGSDAKSSFFNCGGISNSSVIGHLYWHTNATATTIVAEDTPVKAAGTSVAGPNNEKFTHSTGRLTNSSAKPRTFVVTACASLESGNNQIIGVHIAKGDAVIPDSKILTTTSGTGKAENISCHTVVQLAPTEYVEVFVENTTAIANITVTDLNLIAHSL